MENSKNIGYLNEFFDNIYLITLERSSERHEHVKKTLKKIDYSFFWGIDGQQLDIDKLIDENIYSEKKASKVSYDNKGMTPNEIGCAWSHIKVYEDIIENRYQKALIFEDDLIFNPEFNKDLKNILSELPDDWDLLYLGDLGNNDSIPLKHLLRIYLLYPILNFMGKKYDREYLLKHYPRKCTNNLDYAGFQWGLHAYGVTFEGAKKLVNNLYPICRESDTAVGYLNVNDVIQAYRLKEKLFLQDRSLEPATGKRHF